MSQSATEQEAQSRGDSGSADPNMHDVETSGGVVRRQISGRASHLKAPLIARRVN